MSKVIDLTDRTGGSIWWLIRISNHRSDRIRHSYVGDDVKFEGAQWGVVIDASTIDRIPSLIEEAKRQLSREIAIRASTERPRFEGRT